MYQSSYSWKEAETGNRPENTGSNETPCICAGRVSRPVLPDDYGDRLFAKRNNEGAVVDSEFRLALFNHATGDMTVGQARTLVPTAFIPIA